MAYRKARSSPWPLGRSLDACRLGQDQLTHRNSVNTYVNQYASLGRSMHGRPSMFSLGTFGTEQGLGATKSLGAWKPDG